MKKKNEHTERTASLIRLHDIEQRLCKLECSHRHIVFSKSDGYFPVKKCADCGKVFKNYYKGEIREFIPDVSGYEKDKTQHRVEQLTNQVKNATEELTELGKK